MALVSPFDALCSNAWATPGSPARMASTISRLMAGRPPGLPRWSRPPFLPSMYVFSACSGVAIDPVLLGHDMTERPREVTPFGAALRVAAVLGAVVMDGVSQCLNPHSSQCSRMMGRKTYWTPSSAICTKTTTGAQWAAQKSTHAWSPVIAGWGALM